MNEKIEKIKLHVIKHKTVYISMAVGVASAGITCLIMRKDSSGKIHLNGYTSSGKAHLDGHTVFSLINGNENNSTNIFGDKNKIVNVLEREGRGHPGYMVQHKETGIVYMSQKIAADELNLNYKKMSDHLNGRKDHVDGNHFERVKTSSDVA